MKALQKKKMDPYFLAIVLVLSIGGFLIFLSSSTSFLLHENVSYTRIVTSQATALILGLLALYILSHIHYRFFRKYAFIVMITVLLLSLLVFVPGLGVSHGGAVRWVSLGFLNIQPATFLQLGVVIYGAAWLSGITSKINKFSYGLLPLILILLVIALILFSQPDTGTLVVIFGAIFSMFFVAGARWRDILIVITTSILGLIWLSFKREYVKVRFVSLYHSLFQPEKLEILGSGYQWNQSLIAIGSGEVFGRGYGQSVQKFKFLPEASTDSVFAVAAEELGFIGASLILTAFLLLAWRGIQLALRTEDTFARLLVVGIVIMITTQAFVHIAGMLGIFPLSGIPLPFMSLGGTSLLVTLAATGIVLNISRYNKISK